VKLSTKLIIWKHWSGYMKLCKEKRPELWPNDWILRHDNAPAHKALSVKQFLAQKLNYWNGTPTLFSWFGSEWLLGVTKNKVCSNGTQISRHWRHKKKFDDGTEIYSTTGVPKMSPTATGYFYQVHSYSRVVLRRWDLSKSLQWSYSRNFISTASISEFS
jgi:hypothetical protein